MALEPISVPASRWLQNPSNCLGKSIQVTMSEIFAWSAKKFQLMTFVLRGAFFPYTEGTTLHRRPTTLAIANSNLRSYLPHGRRRGVNDLEQYDGY